MKLNTSEAATAPLRCTVRLDWFQLLPNSLSKTVTTPSASRRTGDACCSTVTGEPESAVMVGASFTGLIVVAIVAVAADQVLVPPSEPEMLAEVLVVCAESASRTVRLPGVPA